MTSIAAAPAPAPAAEARRSEVTPGRDRQALASAIADAEERIQALREKIPKLEEAVRQARGPDVPKLQMELDKARRELKAQEARRDQFKAQLAAAGGSDADVAREEMKRRPVDAAGDAKRAKEAQEAATAKKGPSDPVQGRKTVDIKT
ncbi:hypothetical protein HHL28_13075 [Aerophototrophica crusticola]|uniref:Uncharacterized protein n=1 Tax=Aerophototrophica crusticola TaxID=1709002 RepID=A0A858R959_9PROT|nr:hypothetical protein HHL28_13075 [Rhodospirillaceae bacterium B3]